MCRSNTTRWAPARERSWARLGSNQHPLVCETSALPLSYSPIAVACQLGHLKVVLRAAATATAGAFRDLPRRRRGSERQESTRLDSCSRGKLRDKGSNLDLHVQSVVSCRLDDPGTNGRRLHPHPSAGASMQRRTDSRRSHASSVSPASKAERCCPSHSPTLRPWITDRRMRYPGWPTSYVEELWSPSLAHVAENQQAKAGAKYQHPFLSPYGRSLSPSGGASIRSRPSSSWASPRFVSVGHLQKRRRRPFGSPSTGSECG